MLESGRYIPPIWFLEMFVESHSPKLRKIALRKCLDYLVPKLTFMSKFGVLLATFCSYTASFTDETIFPAEKRASAIGTCQMFARFLTILAPEVTELRKPIPIVLFCILMILAILVSFTLDDHKSNDDERSEEKS